MNYLGVKMVQKYYVFIKKMRNEKMSKKIKPEKFNNVNEIYCVLLGTMPVTVREELEFRAIKKAVKLDKYLSSGYRSKPSKKFNHPIVEDANRYFIGYFENPAKRIERYWWTPYKDGILKRRYAKANLDDLARYLGTTKKALYQRAKILGLKRDKILGLKRDKSHSAAQRNQSISAAWAKKRAVMLNETK